MDDRWLLCFTWMLDASLVWVLTLIYTLAASLTFYTKLCATLIVPSRRCYLIYDVSGWVDASARHLEELPHKSHPQITAGSQHLISVDFDENKLTETLLQITLNISFMFISRLLAAAALTWRFMSYMRTCCRSWFRYFVVFGSFKTNKRWAATVVRTQTS